MYEVRKVIFSFHILFDPVDEIARSSETSERHIVEDSNLLFISIDLCITGFISVQVGCVFAESCK